MIILISNHGEKVGVGLVLSSKIYHKAADKMLAGEFKVKDKMPIEEDLIREKFNKPGMFDIIMEENTPNLLEQVDSKKLIEHKEENCKQSLMKFQQMKN